MHRLTACEADGSARFFSTLTGEETPVSADRLAAARVYTLRPTKGVRAAADPSPAIPKQYPLFKQCDGRWGQDLMVTKTLCDVGCLVSSTSMALRGWKIESNNKKTDPGTFNAWLRNHKGYVGDNNFDETAVDHICDGLTCTAVWPSDAMHPTNDLDRETIISYLTRKRVVIAHVRNKTHFVLGIGWDNHNRNVLYVNDPAGRNETQFDMKSGVDGWRIFDMKTSA